VRIFEKVKHPILLSLLMYPLLSELWNTSRHLNQIVSLVDGLIGCWPMADGLIGWLADGQWLLAAIVHCILHHIDFMGFI